MAELTKEELVERAQHYARLASDAMKHVMHPVIRKSCEMDLRLAEIALAALTDGMEQEPVAYMQIDGDEIEYNGHNEFSGGGKGVPLYAAPQLPQPAPEHLAAVATLESKGYAWNGGQLWKPPIGKAPAYITGEQPAVPDAISTRQAISKMEECEPCDSINVAYKYGWNDCRAAMLKGAEPVTTDDKLGTGENCWSCGKYFTYEQHSECDGYCPHCDSPVDLDEEEDHSSRAVPTEPTEEMISNAWREATGKCDHETIRRIYATMLAAAPQQEA